MADLGAAILVSVLGTKMCVSAVPDSIHVKIHIDNRNKSYKTSDALKDREHFMATFW